MRVSGTFDEYPSWLADGSLSGRISAVLLDRDGVIVRNRQDYVKNLSEVELLNGAVNAIASLSQAGHPIAVITNQAGIAHGLVSLRDLDDIHQMISRSVEAVGGRIDGFFVCPHSPRDGCACRKPRPGLLLAAQKQLGFDIRMACLIGDQPSDIEAAAAAGARAILLAPFGRASASASGDVVVAEDLLAASELILSSQRH